MSMSATGSFGSSNATGSKDIIPKGYRKGQLQQFTPDQMKLFQSLFSQVGPDSFMGKLAGGDQSTFDQLEAPALRQLGSLQGGLASRFSGMGTGARKSSGFQLAQGQLASDFAQQLQSQRMGLQQNAWQNLMGMSNQLLGQRPYETSLIKKQTPFWQQLLLGINDAGKEFAGAAGKAAMGGA